MDKPNADRTLKRGCRQSPFLERIMSYIQETLGRIINSPHYAILHGQASSALKEYGDMRAKVEKYDTLKASHTKLVDNLQRATDAVDVLAPEKFIGLVKIRNERVYNHTAAKQALAEAKI